MSNALLSSGNSRCHENTAQEVRAAGGSGRTQARPSIVVGILLLIGAVATSTPAADALDPNGILVFPHSTNVDDQHVARAFTRWYEEILVQLRSVDGLHVISEDLVRPFIGSRLPEEEIARQLGAGSVLVLSVRRLYADEPVTFNALYLDAATGKERGRKEIPQALTVVDWGAAASTAVSSVESARNRPTREDIPVLIAGAQAIILNSALSPEQRVDALGRLPGQGRNAAVVAAAVELATSAEDPALRAKIWYAMRGVRDPRLIQPLLQSLAYDSAPNVRRAAASVLADFLATPGVRDVLTRAQASDPEQQVRDQAQRSLGVPDERRKAEARKALMDETLPDRDRLRAVSMPHYHYGAPVELDDEAAQTVFAIAQRASTDPRIRAGAWMLLTQGPWRLDFATAMIGDLAGHTSEFVRESAVRGLWPYRDDPGVRAALEQTAQNDASAEVRRAARYILNPAR